MATTVYDFLNNPMISVIIPTLDCRELLLGALESIGQQTFQNVEVIISDGGSSDGTQDAARNLLKKLELSYCILEQPGSSIYGAMNLGMQVACGEWLYFLGSDDRFASSTVIEQLKPALQNRKHHVVYGDAWIVNQGRLWCGGEFTARSLGRWTMPHQATFYRASTLQRLRMKYDERYPIEADWDFNLRLWNRVHFAYVDIIVVNYAGDGVSSQMSATPLYDSLAERILQIYGLRAFAFLPSYRLAEACRSHCNPLIRLVFEVVHFWEGVTRAFQRLVTKKSTGS